MVLLMAFALVAGAGTALSPCVLPVLPALLSAGATGGRRRPLGIVTGLVLSFTFATVVLVYVIEALGLPDDLVRTLAIAVLAGFGITLMVPALAARLQASISRLVPGPSHARGEGFGSGLVVGASLGFVYAPCAGPILAGVITVSASQDFTAGKLAVALAFAIGSAAVLYVLILGGRRVAGRLQAIRGQVQVAMGAIMVAVAAIMAADLDTRFQSAIADDLPSFLVNPTGGLEQSESVASDLAAVRGVERVAEEGGAAEAAAGEELPVYGTAPDFAGIENWINTAGGDGLSIARLTAQGEVVLIDFWTYTCINCLRTLPYLKAWHAEYRDDGLTIVGVHTPEFAFEKDTSNVEEAVAAEGIRYPVAQDNDYATWTAFGNQYWPATYLIDAEGKLRYTHFGEGDYETTERAIRSLLAEAGDERLGREARASAESASRRVRTPETYLGSLRAEGLVNGPIVPGVREFAPVDPGRLPPNGFAYGGRWRIDDESATALRGSSLSIDFRARRVFLVLGSSGRADEVEVSLDGRPLPDSLAGEDVRGSTATVARQRLYRLVELPRAGRHALTLELDPGVAGYAFTFG